MSRFRSSSAGNAAIEFALAMPFLLILLTGLAELGYASYQAMRVTNAAEAGALYAAKYGFDVTGIEGAVVNGVGAGIVVTATPAPVQFCGCPGSGGITAIACASTCPDGSASGVYIRVNASIPRETILSYPELGLPPNLVAQSTVLVN